MGRYVDGVEWRVREADRINRERSRQIERERRGLQPWYRRLTAYELSFLVLVAFLVLPILYWIVT